jgi:phage tail protein X
MKYRMSAPLIGLALAAAVTIPAIVFGAPKLGEDYFLHEIRSGETISLICVDYYGHYSGVMGDAIAKLNPGVGNVNNIRVGQKIKLPTPEQPTKVAEKAKAPRPLFEKKLQVTQGVVTYVAGSASLTPHNGKSKTKLTSNTIVYPGDKLETGPKGRVEIIVNSESVMRLGENTRLVLERFRQPEKKQKPTSIQCLAGTFWTKVRHFKDKVSRFELELPTAVAGVHGTVYQTTVAKDSSAEVKVFDGEVAVKNKPGPKKPTTEGLSEVAGPQEVPGPHEVSFDEWVHIVRAMQKISIDKSGNAAPPESFEKHPEDSWEKWNQERDERIAKMFSEPL